MGAPIKTPTSQIFVLNVYLPTDCYENLDEFQSYLYKIHTIFDNNCTANNIAIGDFNASVTARFGRVELFLC